jgi:amino acid transporter
LLIVLLGFAILAVPQIDLGNYAMTRPHWKQMLPLLMVPFVGVEVVASLQGEMRRRTRDAPRALLLVPSLAALFCALVVAVTVGVVGVRTLTGSAVPMAWLGERIVGGAGRPFILIIGAFGLSMAFGSAFTLVVRQIYAMSKDGYWPTVLRRIHPRLGTPVWTILLVALLLLPLAALPGSVLSQLSGLLYLLVLMSVNVALIRRPQMASAPFSLPFHPWIPGLALVLDLFVLPLSELPYLAGAAAVVALGALIYLLYAQGRHVEAKEGVTVFKPTSEERAEAGYRILVPIANPATAGTLLRLAGVLARQEDGAVVALQVVTVPDQVPLEEGRARAAAGRVLLEQALTQAQEENFKLQTMTRVAHSATNSISCVATTTVLTQASRRSSIATI